MLSQQIFSNTNQKWFFLGQIFRLISGFYILLILTRNLRTESLATWYIFTSTFGFASMLELGLGQVVGRHTAYLMADQKEARISLSQIYKFTKDCEKIYIAIALGVGAIAGLSACLTIDFGAGLTGNSDQLLLSWIVYCAGGVATILSGFYGALLSGTGRMWWVQKFTILGSIISLIVTSMIYVVGPTLLIPAAALLISQVTNLLMFRRHLFKYLQSDDAKNSSSPNLPTPKLNTLFDDTSKTVLGMLAFQMLTSGFLLLLSKHYPKAFVASYGLTLQFTTIVITISSTWLQGNFYAIAETKQSKDMKKMQSLFRGALVRSLACCVVGLVAFFSIGPKFLEFIGSNTMLPPMPTLALICVMVSFEFACGLYSQFLVARGELSVAYIALMSAIAVWGIVFAVLRCGLNVEMVFIARIAAMGVFFAIPQYLLYKKHLRRAA